MAMDNVTSTKYMWADEKTTQENILLDIIKEICSDPNSKLDKKLTGKVNRIIADCDLTHYSNFHKIVTSNESTSTVLGFMNQTATELTFSEQAELNQAVISKIKEKIPLLTSELENLKQDKTNGNTSKTELKRDLQQSLDDKLNTLREQENEKVELMMEWLNHRLNEVSTFSSHTNELLTMKTKILEFKSKILHLCILQSIFTETNQSIKAYSEIHKDLKDSLREAGERIKNYKDVIASDYS